MLASERSEKARLRSNLRAARMLRSEAAWHAANQALCAQLLGWRCLYVPGARAYHVRRVNPMNRRAVPGILNMHSVKNRFLMRIKNMSGGLYKRFWRATTARDLLVLGGCFLREPRSIPASGAGTR